MFDVEVPRVPGPERVVVHGHDRTVAALLASFASGRAAQAYLISGPPGVGKRTVARLLAQSLSCAEVLADGSPCGHCRACRMVGDGSFVDLHVVTPPLRIEAVRELRHVLALSPGEARRRVAVLPDVELASAGAANALLKTLEEPAADAVLLLTTSAPGQVPATVRSRCRSVALRPMTRAAIATALASGWGVEAGRADELARLSGGSLGWAVRALTEDNLLAARDAWLGALGEVLSSGLAARLDCAARLSETPEALPAGLSTWRSWWRDVLLLGHGLGEYVVNRDRVADLTAAADRYGVRGSVGALRALDDVADKVAASANARLALDVLVLALPGEAR